MSIEAIAFGIAGIGALSFWYFRNKKKIPPIVIELPKEEIIEPKKRNKRIKEYTGVYSPDDNIPIIADSVLSYDLLIALDFEHWGNITENEGLLQFTGNQNIRDKREGFVYLWVECNFNRNLFHVRYIGATKFDIVGRWNQHKGGFKADNSSGSRHADRIINCFRKGSEIQLWIYHISDYCPMFREDELQQKWNPGWNSKKVKV